jgi:hypothetical protein
LNRAGKISYIPLIYLHLIFDIIEFEVSSLMNWICAGYTGSKNPVLTRKKNPVYQTGNFKLENVKNQVQIDRGLKVSKSPKLFFLRLHCPKMN